MPDYRQEIPFFDTAIYNPKQRSQIDLAIQSVLDHGKYINGPEVYEFSEKLSTYLNVKHVVPCANGTDALTISLLALDLQRGDEVIVPVFNYVAAAEAVEILGLTPAFIDVSNKDFNIEVKEIEKRINSKTKAIIITHLFGAAAKIDHIVDLAHKYNIAVIEDIAQAVGTELNQRKVGTYGDIGCISFFPTKNLACFGDGGAIITNNEVIANKAKMIANHGQTNKYEHKIAGCNSRLDTLQAAILSVQLLYLEDNLNKRRAIAEKYQDGLKDISEICLPVQQQNSFHTFNQYCILLRSKEVREELQNDLKNSGIGVMIYYPKPLHIQEAFARYEHKVNDFPVAEDLCNRILALPVFPDLREEQLQYIISQIRNFFNQ
ncbi:DegT/DnrJ/EryC1/StrS family aminotransferase [Pedobacter montanisoli]|uniref:DegT/DnrJ/EryC1/StrS family aminotransferase n=1 Tax=Pedobacter montanisoli TaxID=2923277 RepID=A0ABS9ZSF7_9SPHI|nr:DegT/DnrJ/EryC1/StrS family aminotransferase [Pedobacter montanisoli]MCJ0741516.1 DegT/DnrJ/EryC1/StrS family aminotransferase [Pedobacter montanisoli]